VSLRETPSVAKNDRLRHCLLGNHVAAFANPQFCWDFSRNFTQHTVPFCTRSAHDGFYVIDFFGLFFLSIKRAQQNPCAENCVFAVIEPTFLGSLHTLFIVPPLLTSQLEKP
jgi:hypothetical protein